MSLSNLYSKAISWQPFFESVKNKKYYKNLEAFIQDLIAKKITFFPSKDLIFEAIYQVSLQDIRVVFIGQDPYFNFNQATGLAFSVPRNVKIPSSLYNIFQNLIKYKHIHKMPNHGCLELWSYQGCLMLNTALTVEISKPNSHSHMWREFSDDLITYISNNTNNLIFVLWGAPALSKSKLIDQNKHKLIVSSHPSGLSCHKNLNKYLAFNRQDHFGLINKYLKKYKKESIIWGF